MGFGTEPSAGLCPLRVRRGEKVRLRLESRGRLGRSARACHIHLRWERREGEGLLIALTGAAIRPAHARPNPRLKGPRPLCPHSLSLSLSPALLQSTPLHSSVVSLTVSVSQSNPVTLLQAIPPHPPVSISSSLPPTLSCVTVPSARLLRSDAAEASGCGRLRPEWWGRAETFPFIFSIFSAFRPFSHFSFNSPSSPKWCL